MGGKKEIYDWCKAEGKREAVALNKFENYLKSKIPVPFLAEEERNSLCNVGDRFMLECGLLEEMCVILNNDYEYESIYDGFSLSETLFMREHYGSDKLICWSHSLWEVITIVKEGVLQFRSSRKKTILDLEKVKKLLEYFNLVCSSRGEINDIIGVRPLIGIAP
jgi:hypothetical protein